MAGAALVALGGWKGGSTADPSVAPHSTGVPSSGSNSVVYAVAGGSAQPVELEPVAAPVVTPVVTTNPNATPGYTPRPVASDIISMTQVSGGGYIPTKTLETTPYVVQSGGGALTPVSTVVTLAPQTPTGIKPGKLYVI